LRRTHDTNAPTTSEVEQSVIAQFVQGTNYRVLIDSQYRCEVDRGRQTLALHYLSLGNGSSNLRGDLYVDGDISIADDFHDSNDTITRGIIEGSSGELQTMTILNQPTQLVTEDFLDEEALIEEAHERARRRRHLRVRLAVVLLAAVFLGVVGVVDYSLSSSKTGIDHSGISAAALTCPHARVKLLGVTAIPGAAIDAGLIVRASVSSHVACSMSGYPLVGAELASDSTAKASNSRNGYLPGGMETTNGPLPRILITSRSRVVSFTIQWWSGNGPTCPQINAIQFTLPGSRTTLAARSMFEPGVGVTQGMGIYCGALQVRPLVNGPSGNAK
jgi:hypothetical protein